MAIRSVVEAGVCVLFADCLDWPMWKDHIRPYLARIESNTYSRILLRYIDAEQRDLHRIEREAPGIGVTVERFTFRLIDIKDDRGLLIRLRIPAEDYFEVGKAIVTSSGFEKGMRLARGNKRLSTFLFKEGVFPANTLISSQGLGRCIYVVNACLWAVQQMQESVERTVLFYHPPFWHSALALYAEDRGLTLIPAVFLRDRIAGFRSDLRRHGRIALQVVRGLSRSFLGRGDRPDSGTTLPQVGSMIYSGCNLDDPADVSDFFYWFGSGIPADQLTAVFAVPKSPLNKERLSSLSAKGVSCWALSPEAMEGAEECLFQPHVGMGVGEGFRRWQRLMREGRGGVVQRAFSNLKDQFQIRKEYWNRFFGASGIKVFVDWHRYSGEHCAMAEALKERGGVFALYQKALEVLPNPVSSVDTDIFFCFSGRSQHVEEQQGSRISQMVAVGYHGDGRFPALRKKSLHVRQKLEAAGAKRIVAFFDENSLPDERWHTGNSLQQRHYTAVLSKLLATPDMGLVIKPKVPATLRNRLGQEVSLLLREAVATGRCHVYEAGAVVSTVNPVEAALAADIAIHGHLCGGTAAVESALAGVPVLLMDDEGWEESPLYDLGVGKIVFKDWESLWGVVDENVRNKRFSPDLGVWPEEIIDTYDPFRDGHATERMGVYIRWLLEGFRAGLSRDVVMADAAERYCRRWGKDKVLEIKGDKGLLHVG